MSGHEERETNGSFDTSGQDRVTLSAHERQTLAHLEERMRLDDPDFAVRMRGRSWRWMRRMATSISIPQLPTWAGPLLLVVGLVATLLVVGALPWLSIVTLGIAFVGAHGVGRSLEARVAAAAERRSSSHTD